jgi:hypothetical protein
MSRSSTYTSWAEMLRRCRNPHNDADRLLYACVSVHPSWDPRQGGSFEQFLSDVGERPAGTSLDRYPDCHGNYEPGNVRWGTPSEQANNKRNSRHISYNNETLTVAQWGKRLGIGYSTLLYRLNSGWSVEQIMQLRPDVTNRVS